MMHVYKYEVPIEDHFTLMLPRTAQILDVQTQKGGPQLWALVDPAASLVRRQFILRGTGHRIDFLSAHLLCHCGTFQMHRGELVFHVFEVLKERSE